MSLSTSDTFNKAAAPAAASLRKRKRPAPFPIRLSAEERAYLEHKAGGRPLGTYIRAKLLDGRETHGRKARRAPSMDYALLGQILGALGASDLSRHICLLAVAAESGRLELPDRDRSALRDACSHVREMRLLLIKALGLKPEARG